ncbi:unnamed protein product (macronuclear) [Paramecium tetraurelia]|uniref:Uncharacterized protein n=1 Tax=Paramecium tetraurelia TaxID=5888 RepID=A0BZE8_PARTE|nr:uncharacterized protein GSPATT00033768001 [Paramecium tetraurelia]CAK63915.1 unnamed protein product [Paramecium tetraurelia]|eukprot:XP_001431313.1 hypothetical protein (macronuclear) [Paramecium tetraurelia strain d4-2]
MNQKKKKRVLSFQIQNLTGTLSEMFDSQQSTNRKLNDKPSINTLQKILPFNEIDQFFSPKESGSTTMRSIPKLRKSSISPKHSYIYSRKTIQTPLRIRSSIVMLNQFEQQFAESIQCNDQIGAIESLLNMMVIAVEQDNIALLITFMRLSALTFISFQEWTKALLFLSHCKFLSEFTRQFNVIQWTFLQIGILCKYVKKYEQGKIFIKKSLEYAWHLKDIDQEIICYEELGKLCFLNYELKIAKSLHEKSMKGTVEKEKSPMKMVSSKGMQQIMKMLPQEEMSLGLHIFSKAVNFPIKLIQCQNPLYYQRRQVKNQYMISHNLECIPNQRVIDIDISLDEMLQQFLRGKNFAFEIPIPISVADEYESMKPTNQIPKVQQLKQTQTATLIKLQSLKLHPLSNKQPTIILNDFQKKLPLEEMVRQRLEMKFQSPSFTETLRSKKFSSNLEQIRLTHERVGIALSVEHSKRGLVRYAQKLLSQQQITFI